jgi:nicotinamidase-related amidase
MALTRIDGTAALVVIDMQKGIVGMIPAQSASEIIERVARLTRAFREHRLPVILVNVTARAPGRTEHRMDMSGLPPDWTELIPELDRQPGDLLVTKLNMGAFHGTALDLHLRRRGATQIVLCGISTTAGVESTARSGYDQGYNVAMVVDAMTDRNAESHEHSVEKIFPRIGETATTDEVLAMSKQRKRE